MPVLYDSAVVLDNFILSTLIHIHTFTVYTASMVHASIYNTCMFMYGSAVILVGRSEGEEI